jgi:hypothetical protein
MADQNLTLQEQLALLFVDGTPGHFRQSYFRLALAGGALAELLRRRRVQIEGSQIKLRQTAPISDAAIDGAYSRFTLTGRPRSASWWIQNFYPSESQPLQILAGRLVARGILCRDERRALWVIRWHTYSVLEPAHGQRLRRHIRDAVMKDEPVDAELSTLISVLHNARALDMALDAIEIADREHRIAAISASYPIPYAVGKAIAIAIQEKEELARRQRDVIIIGPGPRPPRHRKPPRPWKPDFPGPPRDDNEPWTVTA